MHMIYNSPNYCVVEFKDAQGVFGGFEIMDKSSRKGIYLQGAVAESFQRGVQALVEQGPDPEALDAYLAGYTALAQQPLVLH